MRVETSGDNKTKQQAANQNKQRNYVNRTSTVKPSIEQVKYIKTFDSFEEGIKDMMEKSKDVAELINETTADISTVEGAMDAAIQILVDHMPSFNERLNLHYDLTISANKCSIKTDRYLTFGWYINSRRSETEKDVFNTKYIFHIIIFGENKSLVSDLLNNKWTVDTYKK